MSDPYFAEPAQTASVPDVTMLRQLPCLWPHPQGV